MIFVKENFSMLEESYIKIYDYEEFKNNGSYSTVVKANMCLLRINTIFLYLKYRNDIGIESESYYHIVSDNKDDCIKIKELIHSKVTISYVNEKHFNDYMNKLYPEIVKDYTYDNFCRELGSFDKAVNYNWKYLNINKREKLVKYALGIDYSKDDEALSNNLYNEIKNRFKNREINSQIDYQILDNIIKDGSKRIYNNLNNDYTEYNKWYEQEILEKWSTEEKENCSMESINKMFEELRRKDAHILTPKIENIYANMKKKTIVIKWQTGETTKVTCHENDTWDIEKGIMACITKYVLGNNYGSYNALDKYIKSVKYSGCDYFVPNEVIEKVEKLKKVGK